MALLSADTGARSMPFYSLPQDELSGQCDVTAVTNAQEGAVSPTQGFPGRWHWLGLKDEPEPADEVEEEEDTARAKALGCLQEPGRGPRGSPSRRRGTGRAQVGLCSSTKGDKSP